MSTLLSKLPYWRENLRELFFPQGCALCGKALLSSLPFSKNKDVFYGLCLPCRESLAIPETKRGRCSVCGQPLISEQGTCLPCRNGPKRSFDKVISLYPYMGKYKKILGDYKFKRRLSLGNYIAEKIAEGIKLLQKEIISKTEVFSDFCLVPVPPKAGKIKHSGWDQIEYLAKLLETNAQNKYFLQRCLKRLPSVSQKKLNKENRLVNLKGKIIACGKTPATAIIFDDVYTTGATMDACAAVLKLSGTKKVFGICLCYD